MAEHTPGPWEFDKTGGGQVRATDHNGSFPICDIRGWGHLTGHGHGALGLPPEEGAAIQEANARLIAAAPAMLEALRLGIQLAESGGHGDGTNCPTCHFLRAARAAVAATGEEKADG